MRLTEHTPLRLVSCTSSAMYHDAYAGIAVVCMSGIIVIQSGCQGKRHTHIVISFVHQPFKGYRERYRVAFARLKRQGNGIDQHCQAWDATTATDVCEEVHRTGRLMVAGMCRHLHQHLIRDGIAASACIPLNVTASQRTGSVAKLAQYRFRRILVYVGGTLPVVVSNRNGCGMRRQALREGGPANRHRQSAHQPRPADHTGQHIRPKSSRRIDLLHRVSTCALTAHHHRNNRSGGQCHDFVLAFHPGAKADGCRTNPRLHRRWHRIRLRPLPHHCRRIHCHSCVRWCCRIRIPRLAALAHRSADTSLGLAAKQNPVFPKACHQLPVDA